MNKAQFNEHAPMIKRIAWSFHHTTGLDYDELYAEACLAYCEASKTFNSEKYQKLTTYAYPIIVNALRAFIIKEKKQHPETKDMGIFEAAYTPMYEFFTNVSEDLKKVANIIFSNENLIEQMEQVPPKMARGIFVRHLKENYGYNPEKGWRISENVRKELTQIEIGNIIL